MDNKLVGQGWRFSPGINTHGGVALVHDEEEIAQAIRIILGTAQGERVMRPDFGSQLHELVFAPINEHTMALARRYVEDALARWEPRISVKQIDIRDPFQTDAYNRNALGCLAIEIQYEIKLTADQRTLVYPFYLIPGE